MPNGAKLTFAMRKHAMPNGIPMIVQHQRMPDTTAATQSQMPAKTIQIRFSRNVQTPADSPRTISLPKGKKANSAILNEAIPYGIPTIVQQKARPNAIHDRPSHSPQNRNQITFEINTIAITVNNRRSRPVYIRRLRPTLFDISLLCQQGIKVVNEERQ